MNKLAKPILSFLALAISNISFASTTLLIYRDLGIVESETTNQKILIPLSAYDLEIYPKNVVITEENTTNICTDKDLYESYTFLSNEIYSLSNKISTVLNELSILSNRMNIIFEIAKFAQTSKDLNAILSNSEATQKEIILRKSKLEELTIELHNKLEELKKSESKLKEKTFSFKELKLSVKPQKIFYKIKANWSLKYILNPNENTGKLNVKISLPFGSLIKANEVIITTLGYTPDIIKATLPKLRAYLREKEPFILSKKMTIFKSLYGEDLKEQPMKEELPQLQEIPSHNVTWSIKGDFIITNSQYLELNQLNLSINQKFFAIPSKYQNGILVIEVSNTSPITLLPGEIEINLDNKTTKGLMLTESLPQNGIFKTDGILIDGIIVKKETVQDRIENPALFGKNIKNTKVFKNKVKNSTSKEVVIEVLERIPIPSDNRISINIISINPKPNEEINSIKTNGTFSWTIQLKPGEEKELIYSFSIEYPKDLIYYEVESD